MKLNPSIIQGFVGSVLAKRFDEGVKSPHFHYELWELACSDHPFVAVAAPRGHAKSTAGTLAYGLAELLFRNSRFCVIVSDTEAQATMFVQAMKQELSENTDLINLFGIKRDEKGIVSFPKDTETDVIVECKDGHSFRIIAKGAEQKLRGMLWNGLRPDLVLIDDLENDELVMNKERRDKLRRWFRGALIPMLSRKGKLRMWGTILHMDSVLENLMPNETDKWYRETDLKVWSDNPRKTMWKSVKYRAHNPDFSQVLWPERYSEEFFKMRQAEYAAQGMLDLYSQEYLNNPIDESVSYFKKTDFLPEREEDRDKNLHYYITADLAVSLEQRADYSVFLVAGIDEDRVVHVKNVIRERMDAREIVQTLLTLNRLYEPEAVGIEKMLISQTLGPFLREEMVRQNTFLNLIQLSHSGKDKVQRARNIQARLRAKTIKFDKSADWYPTLEDELLKFPRGVKDDQVDAFAYMGMLLDKMVEAPTKEEIEEDEYDDEFRDSGLNFGGRSTLTGY
jgi:predicted phage terminase large subunit-like protein